jgi:hypothetical protein
MARSLRIGGSVGHRATPLAPTPNVDSFLALVLWNPVVVLDGHEPGRGIRDYDLVYFDDRDLSWEAEDAVIRRWAALALDADIGRPLAGAVAPAGGGALA